MKRFNVDKELKKLNYRRNKIKYIKGFILISCLVLAFLGGLFFTKSKYEESNSLEIINSKVESFTYKDYIIASYINGEETLDIPSKGDGYEIGNITCDTDATAIWDNDKWGILVTNAKKRTRCSVFFTSTKPSEPELYDGLIAVTYDSSGNVIVADTSKEWYDYAKHNWANAVLVDNTIKSYSSYNVGDIIPMSEILQMYVWIPRYKYLLWNADNGSSEPQAINIIFEDKNTTKSTGTKNGEWLTHPAFTFGSAELNGIWVGKFENSNGTLTNSNDLTNIQIKPNVVSMVNVNVSNMFNAVRNIELHYSSRYGVTGSSIDTHMIKNMEWGAVAYLTNSVYGRYVNTDTCIDSGCEVWINNTHTGTGCESNGDTSLVACGGTVTGCSGTSVSAEEDNNRTTCQSGYDWATLGVNASTTGNMYGLYDMSGGAWEYVMGNMVNSSGSFYSSRAEFTTAPDSKYYDSYAYSESPTNHAIGKIGDATRETLANFGLYTGSWYNDFAALSHDGSPWFVRGGRPDDGTSAGVFSVNRYHGGVSSFISFRTVLTAE